jgi:integrase/recombinase XerD
MLLSIASEKFIKIAPGNKYSPKYMPTVKSIFRCINNFFGKRKLESLTLDDWYSYLAYLRFEYKPKRLDGDESSLSEATVDNHRKVIRSFYSWASEILSIPRVDLKLPRPKFQSPQTIPYTQEEIKRFLVASQSTRVETKNRKPYKIKRSNATRDKAMILVLLDTGLRAGELSRLRMDDVNLENQEIYIRPYRAGRKSKARTVFFGNKTKQALGKYLTLAKPRPNERLFKMEPNSIRWLIRRIGNNANVPNSHPHRFRSTFAITYLRNHGDVYTLQRLLGHSTLDMALHYLNIADSDVANKHYHASPVDNWL